MDYGSALLVSARDHRQVEVVYYLVEITAKVVGGRAGVKGTGLNGQITGTGLLSTLHIGATRRLGSFFHD